MTSVPTFAIRPTFLGVERASADAAICVAGIPFDLGTSNRPGARFGPSAIRQASRMLVDGDHPASWTEMERLDLAILATSASRTATSLEPSLTSRRRRRRSNTSSRWAATTRSPSRCCARWRAGRERSGWCISTVMSTPGRRASA